MCGVYSVPHTHELHTHRRTNIPAAAAAAQLHLNTHTQRYTSCVRQSPRPPSTQSSQAIWSRPHQQRIRGIVSHDTAIRVRVHIWFIIPIRFIGCEWLSEKTQYARARTWERFGYSEWQGMLNGQRASDVGQQPLSLVIHNTYVLCIHWRKHSIDALVWIFTVSKSENFSVVFCIEIFYVIWIR